MFSMNQAFSWLKGITLIHWAAKAIKQLWPFLLLFIFWPEIDSTLSKIFPFWADYCSEVSSIISNGALYLRQIPVVASIFDWLAKFFKSCKNRLIMLL